ncbi:hypothetical protein [Alicyclobacillus acidocaldarius]|uniref:Putative transcriptional regulator, CopG family n=1 Tax=Alicyclobacillus acidocaldarius (strain Tc-4-1) TaxID=1048834 RepID=F8IH53_ALIAT|nr:hypothetical protein [Alicyclobacillus acidocaldarius]AEJ44407.1 putative transcriptional regulator, CopG family [Alicyclobacillus acidocaldarius subsp. acidocaldarius Tc-4-1]
MPTEMKRYVVSIPDELLEKLDAVKQQVFYSQSWSETLRALIEKGADQYLEQTKVKI